MVEKDLTIFNRDDPVVDSLRTALAPATSRVEVGSEHLRSTEVAGS